MDNQNDPTSSVPNMTAPPADAWPAAPAYPQPNPSPQTAASAPTQTWSSDPIQPTPTPVVPEPTQAPPIPADIWPNPSQPVTEPVSPGTWPSSPQTYPDITTPDSNAWPTIPQPSSDTNLPQNQALTPPEPTPTFMPPTAPPEQVTPSLSSLDNPLGAPAQPPAIDGSDSIPQTTQPSWDSIAEPAPTDLSHLITNNTQPEPASPDPETVIIPSGSGSNPEVPSLPAEEHKGIPKWLLGVGGGLLVLVIGASAYFILGIGQPAKTTTSLPAVTTPKTANEEIKPAQQPVAAPEEQPSEQPAASGSANFGELDGNNTQPTQASGSSIIDTLRQRQQQERQ